MNAFDLALKYLSYRPRSEKEIRDYLKKKEFSDKKIEETVEKLKYYDYINDKAFIRFALEQNKLDHYGRRRVIDKLKKRGISKALLEEAESMISEKDEKENCLYHFKKIYKRTQNETYRRRIPKIISYLNTRGFSTSLFKPLLDKIPHTASTDTSKLEDHLEHYFKMYRKKGYDGFELKNKITKALLSRGYDYEQIKERVAIKLEEC